MIEIVPYQPEHADGVIDVILPIQQEEFGIPITLEAQPDLREIPAFYQRGRGNFWVALDGGEVVGTLGLLDIGNGDGALRKMFVRSTHRGASRGVAQRLLGTLFGWCRERGIRRILLGTTEKFHAAHRFYEKHGFIEIGRGELPQSFPVMAVDAKFYTRSLGG